MWANNLRLALIGMSRECSKLDVEFGLGSWCGGFTNKHVEDNCVEIWGGLLLGEYVVIWGSKDGQANCSLTN